MRKAAFVKKFSDFITENVPYYSDVKSLVYVVDNDNNEWLYIDKPDRFHLLRWD